jgi:hypothetical protein
MTHLSGRVRRMLLGFLLAGSLACGVASAQSGTYFSFDCPQSTNTQAVSINNNNWVVGTCVIGDVTRSFYRTASGYLHQINVGKGGVFANDINDSNVMTGWNIQPHGDTVGFTYASGVATTFEYPGATTTMPFAINASGAVTGLYTDSTGTHGFVRDSAGNFSSFDPLTSGYTVPRSINASGVVAGFFYNGSAATQAFVRDAEGNITTYTVPNSYATTAFQINDAGAIAGTWTGSGATNAQGYRLDASGKLVTFSAPGAGSTGFTFVWSLNSFGEVTGDVTEGSSPYDVLGYMQTGNSEPAQFSEPNATVSTTSMKINDAGLVTGSYQDSTGTHGYVGKP